MESNKLKHLVRSYKRMLKRFTSRIISRLQAASSSSKYDLTSYMKKTEGIDLNYSYDLTSNKFYTKLSMKGSNILTPELLNNDIKQLRALSTTGITTINIREEDIRPLLDEDNSDVFINEISNDLVYITSEDKIFRYASTKDPNLTGVLDANLQTPIKAIAVNNSGDSIAVLLGTKENNIKLVDNTNDTKILYCGQYFGIIFYNGEAYMIYSIACAI